MNLQEAIVELEAKGYVEAADKLRKRTDAEWAKCETTHQDGVHFSRTRGEKEGHTLQDWLWCAFEWCFSPEENDYWWKIYNELCNVN